MLIGKAKVRNNVRLYAIGDIHGCLNELEHLLEIIDRDLIKNPIEKHKLIFLGDYIDRGPKNKEVISKLIELDNSKRKTVFLRGNHDEKLLNFLKVPEEAGEGFLRWGGDATIAGYGVSFESNDPYQETSSKLSKLVPKSHIKFLKSLKYLHTEDDYLFVHAGIRPNVSLDKQDPQDLMWIRGDFLKYEDKLPKVVVHGHTPVSEPDIRSNRINVDTRCYDTGRLTAVALEGKTQRFLQTNGS